MNSASILHVTKALEQRIFKTNQYPKANSSSGRRVAMETNSATQLLDQKHKAKNSFHEMQSFQKAKDQHCCRHSSCALPRAPILLITQVVTKIIAEPKLWSGPSSLWCIWAFFVKIQFQQELLLNQFNQNPHPQDLIGFLILQIPEINSNHPGLSLSKIVLGQFRQNHLTPDVFCQ